MAGVLATLSALASLLGFGPGAVASADVSLVLGALAAILGGAGLYRCYRGAATNPAVCGWAVGLGVVFGMLPAVILAAVFAAPS